MARTTKHHYASRHGADPANRATKTEGRTARRLADRRALDRLRTGHDPDGVLFAPPRCGDRWNWD